MGDEAMKQALAGGVIMGMSAAFLWHFSNIWRYGEHLVGEQSILIRSLETAGLLVILGFGYYLLDNARGVKG